MTKNTSEIVRLALSGVAISALLSTSAMAQGDEIVVTATKREQTLQEVPVAVSVVDAETIENAQIVDFIDLSASVPSLRIEQLQNSSQTNFYIRGFGNGANNPGIETAVGVFIDGVFRARSASAILDLPTLERVEVLRGPQATLFGKNVSVGAISITTKKPEFETGGSLEFTRGNLNQYIVKGTVTAPITDTIAFRASGSINQRDGQYTNLVTGDDNINERDRWAARGQLLWEPTDNFSARLVGEYNRIDEICCGAVQLVNGPATQLIGAPEPFGLGAVITPAQSLDAREVAIDDLPTNVLVGRGGSLHLDWDIGFGEITSITSWRQQIDENNGDVDFSGSALATNPIALDSKAFTQEVRIAGVTETGVGVFNWLAGGFYFDDDVTFSRDVAFGVDTRTFIDAQLNQLVGTDLAAFEGASQLAQALTTGPTALFPQFSPVGGADAVAFGGAYAPNTGVVGDYTLDNRSFSLFSQIDWEITDRLTITGGVSYIEDRKIATGISTLTDPFSAFDLSQFNTSGGSFVAASIFGDLIGTPFDNTNPTPFFVAAQTLAATDPATFAATQAGAVAAAQGALAADPTLNPLLPLTGFDVVQFFQPQVNFPAAGATREGGNTLSDDGFVNDGQFNYTARIAYDLFDNEDFSTNVYFNYGTGYKAAAVSLTSDSQPPTVRADGQVFGRFADPERSRAYEIGLKTNFNRGYVNIALFDQQVDNFQSNIFTGSGFIITNADVQSAKGIEVDASYSPVDPLNLTFGLTYIDAEYESFPLAPCAQFGAALAEAGECDAGQEFFDATGETPSAVPPVAITTAATYTHDFANDAVGLARIEYVYESDTLVVESVPQDVASRTVNVLNANVSYTLPSDFTINLWGRNLTNDSYLLSAFPTVIQTGSFSGYVNTPRTWGVTIRKGF